MAKPPLRAQVTVAPQSSAPKPAFAKWSKAFLSELAATSNVTAAAKKAGVSTTTAYDARRTDAEFNRKWQHALCEGYDYLEIEMLQRLRTGEVKPPTGAKRGTRSFDNATAFRLLSAHRESAARQRAIRDNQDADTILVSINAKLERMRQRTLSQAPDESTGADEAE
jgi:molybdenum-dependent DNA-binding transcriptional regulator ModE